jgi:Zn-dependent M28 family amino/carboxypeptidase
LAAHVRRATTSLRIGAQRSQRGLHRRVATFEPGPRRHLRSGDRAFLNLALNYKYDAPDDPERIYERSDHYEYAQKGIPVAFFFTGLHGDYHRVTDEVDRIDFDKLRKVAQTVLATAWTLADAPDRPRLDHAATR